MSEIITGDFGTVAKKLRFFFVLDCSGSMSEERKMEQLNQSIVGIIPEMINITRPKPHITLYVRAVKFHTIAEWHIKDEVPIEELDWHPVPITTGLTAMGEAIRKVMEALNTKQLGQRNTPPAILLVTDGNATDDFETAVDELNRSPWGRKASKVAIGIGTKYARQRLLHFVDGKDDHIIEATRPQDIVDKIRLGTTMLIQEASDPALIDEPEPDNKGEGVYLPKADQVDDILNATDEDVF